jgi:hypothetical protein
LMALHSISSGLFDLFFQFLVFATMLL